VHQNLAKQREMARRAGKELGRPASASFRTAGYSTSPWLLHYSSPTRSPSVYPTPIRGRVSVTATASALVGRQVSLFPHRTSACSDVLFDLSSRPIPAASLLLLALWPLASKSLSITSSRMARCELEGVVEQQQLLIKRACYRKEIPFPKADSESKILLSKVSSLPQHSGPRLQLTSSITGQRKVLRD
jgi:hypothetical protein